MEKIILDCDPGHDDAVAMLLAYANPNIDLLGVTTVAGNQTIEKVTHNALAVAEILNMYNVPIFKGSPQPLVREIEVSEEIHGESGLEGAELPIPSQDIQEKHAVDFIIETVMANEPNTITLVPTGSLTNIALAVKKEPKIIERVKEIVLMGGGFNTGNWSPVAEFNIAVDPEAAHIVFNQEWELTMVGLDLTHQALATDDVFENINNMGTKTSSFFVDLLKFFQKAYKENQDFVSPPVHDPCTIAYLIDPTIVTTKKAPIDIELNGSLTVGMTVVDFRQPIPEDCNTHVAVKLDHSKFWDLIYDAIKIIG
ncbi:nucleoside hydrolase [Tetragenococcus halophilus]|uniref:uridine-preferring nucleoside hydrolase UriH n=1 Tax=Tetragenococcus halophilus TaxID=51669 RepID=UPI0030C938B9